MPAGVDSLPPGDREWLVGVIRGVEARIGRRLDDLEQRLAAVERATQAHVVTTQSVSQLSGDVTELTSQVRTVLSQTIRQSKADFEQDLKLVELEAAISRRTAKTSAITSGTIASVVSVVALILERLLS